MKKPGLWDHGVATGGPGQKPDKKKNDRSVRQQYVLWRVNSLISISHQPSLQLGPRLQRVRLAHLRCNPQNMSSLVCHCTECIHTQYAPVRYGWLYIPLFFLLTQYQKLFWKVLKNFSKYREILPKFWEIIWKYFKEKSENFENYCGKFRGIFP